jgi:DNA excision repair protein ERCC-6-like 2
VRVVKNPDFTALHKYSLDPAHDLQAMDRAYRFGQTRDVHVYRLLGAGSLEELIYARQVYKQQQMAIGYQASIQTRYVPWFYFANLP